ncbi:MAG: hypothetical protein HRT61_07005 [Ekhidna sp.]|nr:hypothetical protein [Ekhidna sp.]
MKRLIAFGLLLCTFGMFIHGQELQLQSFYSKTVMGLQQGYGVRFVNDKALGVGFIYQRTVKRQVIKGGSLYPFWGVELAIPIKRCGDLRFTFLPKLGLVSNQFLVVIPEVETSFKLNRWLSAGLITGIRAREASNGLKLTIHI